MIDRIDWVYENFDNLESDFFIQELDDLLANFDSVNNDIKLLQQKELDNIREQFHLADENVGRLWKILLKRKVDVLGYKKLYYELKKYFAENNITILSFEHFQDTWTNPDSDSLLPRGNKVFRLLCDYLKLPNSYRWIIYQLRNETIQGKRDTTRIYNRLLSNLFSDGCFNPNINIKEKLEPKLDFYKQNYKLDELGLDEEYPLDGLMTLVNLISPEIKLKELRSIKKHSNE